MAVTAVTPGTRSRWRAAGVAWGLWTLTLLGLAATAWLDQLLRQAGRPELVQLDAEGVAVVLAAVSAATAGAVLASHRPRHPVGWLLLAFGLVPPGLSYAASTHYAPGRPGTLPWAEQLATWPATFVPA